MPALMSIRGIIGLHRVLLVATLALALVATGFGHRLSIQQEQMQDVVLASGVSLADICGGEADGAAGEPGCLACQIAGAAHLPPANAALADLELTFVATVIAPRESRAVARVLDPAHGMRAPPLA